MLREKPVRYEVLQILDYTAPPKALGQFLSPQYFERRWVVQEIHASRSTMVVCSEAAIDWRAFTKVISIFFHTNSWYSESEKRDSSPLQTSLRLTALGPKHQIPKSDFVQESVRTVPHELFVQGTPDIWDYLEAFSYTECSDERDAIYALISMTSHDTVNDFHPDYSLSTEKAFLAFARHLVGGGQAYNVILSAARYGRDPADSALPSWVPDWRYPEAQTAASRRRSIETSVSSNGHVLHLRGRLLGSVRELLHHRPLHARMRYLVWRYSDGSVYGLDYVEALRYLRVGDLVYGFVTEPRRQTAMILRRVDEHDSL